MISRSNANSIPQHLRELEESLLLPDVRKSNRLVELLDDEFVEFGSSGRTYNKAELVAALHVETPIDQTTSDFRADLLGADIALVTYRIHRHSTPPMYTLRSSIWRLRGDGWRMVFHQATVTSAPE